MLQWPLWVKKVPHILRGSVVTHLRCGRIVSDNFTVNSGGERSLEVSKHLAVMGKRVLAVFWLNGDLPSFFTTLYAHSPGSN